MMMRFRHLGLTAALALTLGASPLAGADSASQPYEIWRKAYDQFLMAEQARTRGNPAEAIRLYDEARNSYLSVKQSRPEWNQELIDTRIASCDDALAKLRAAATPPAPAPAAPATSAADATAPAPEVEAELAATKEKLFKALIELNELHREQQGVKANSQEIESLLREKRLLQEKYGMLEQQYQTLLDKSASPDSEKQAMQKQLLEAQVNYDLLLQKGQLIEKKLNETSEELAKLYQERNQMRFDAKNAADKIAQLERDVTRLTTLQQTGEDATAQLQSRITTLTTERDEARSQFAGKQKEYEQLLTRLTDKLGNDQTSQLLASDNQALQQKYDELQRDYNTLNSDFRAAREQQRELQLKLTRQGDTLQRIDDTRSQLEQANKDLTSRLDQQNTALELSRNTEKQATERARVLDASLKELQVKAAASEERLKTRENAELQNTESRNAEMQKLRDQLTAAGNQAAEQTAAIETAKSKLAEAENRISEMRQEFINVKAANASLEVDLRQLNDLRNRNKELESTVAELQARPDGTETIAKLEQDLAAARKEIETMTAAAAAAPAPVAAAVEPAPAPAAAAAALPPSAPAGNVRGTVRILTDDEIAAGLKSAREAMANDTSDLAIWEYKRILRSKPDQLDANRELGRICLAEQRFFDAEAYLGKALAQTPDDIPLKVDWAMALIGAGEAQKALDVLQQLVTAQPDLAAAHWGLGRADFQLNRLQDAEVEFRRALELDGANSEALLDLARLLIVLDRKEEAAGCYERARNAGVRPDSSIENALGGKLAVNRDLGEFMVKAAQESIGARDWDSAAWYYGQLTGMEPGNDEWQNRLALVQLQRGDATAALAAVTASRGAHPKTDPATEALRSGLAGAAYLTARQPAEAAKCFNELAAVSAVAPWRPQNFFAPLPAMIQETLTRLGQSPDVAQAEVKQAQEAWAKVAGATTGKNAGGDTAPAAVAPPSSETNKE